MDELAERIRALEAERFRPVPRDWKNLPDQWHTPKARRQALAEAIGSIDTYTPED